jgi:hypothetical protein
MILVLDAAYPYKMSYVDYWRDAWLSYAGADGIYTNICNRDHVKSLAKNLKSASLVVLLHSCTADTNLWLDRVKKVLSMRSSPLIIFVGNEYNTPNLSMERRLRNIRDLNPEVIASQLKKDTAEWLYKDLGKSISSIPHGMPKPLEIKRKTIDFAYYGFRYPSYIFQNHRNLLLNSLIDEMRLRGFRIQFSEQNRLNQNEWMALLLNSKFTASTEAGSRFVFKSDSIWNHLSGQKLRVSSDNAILHLARRLPTSVKSSIRRLGRDLGVEYGSIEARQPKNLDLEVLLEQFEYRDGTCVSSRHLEAISAGCWQILYKGNYNGVLKPGIHYTELSDLSESSIKEKIDEGLEVVSKGHPMEIRDELFEKHSYLSRVSEALSLLP